MQLDEVFANIFAESKQNTTAGEPEPLGPSGVTARLARLAAWSSNTGDVWIGGPPGQVLAGGNLQGGPPDAINKKGIPLAPGDIIDWPLPISEIYLDFEDVSDGVGWVAFNVNSTK